VEGEGGRRRPPSLIAMLNKEPEMPQPDAFCEHTIQQIATVVGASPWIPLEELTALPETS